MARLIDADALVAELKWLQSQVSSTSAMEISEYIARINAQPTIDAVEVVHGRWKKRGKNLGECSECGEVVMVRYRYCPDCGAKMEKEE